MLWGSYAQKKGSIIDASKHCVLKAPHPSPLSAHRGFWFKAFSKANQYLTKKGRLHKVDSRRRLITKNYLLLFIIFIH